MAGTSAGLLSPRRLVLCYLVVAIIGVVLMMTASGSTTFEPNPVLSPPPATIAEGSNDG